MKIDDFATMSGSPQNGRSRSRQYEDRTQVTRIKATLYDAVAGKAASGGFWVAKEHQSANKHSSKAERVLFRKSAESNEVPLGQHDADETLNARMESLPDAELLKDLHAYVADFYENVSKNSIFNFCSFDETALISMGILLEEACREAIGENGDLVFSEPLSRSLRLPENKFSRHQIIGRVVPQPVREYQSSSEQEVEIVDSPIRKRQRRRYRTPDD